MAWITDDGYRIEVVIPSPGDDYRDHCLRVTRGGAEVGHFATVGELCQVVDIRGLRPADAAGTAA